MLKDITIARLNFGIKVLRRGGKHWNKAIAYLERIVYDHVTMLYIVPALYHRFIAVTLKWIWKIVTLGIEMPVYTVKIDW